VIVVDTGPLVAALDADDADHERCVRTLETHQGRLLVPGPALTEVCWLLERERGNRRGGSVPGSDRSRGAGAGRRHPGRCAAYGRSRAAVCKPAVGCGGRLGGRGRGAAGRCRGRNSRPAPLHGRAASARIVVRAVAVLVVPRAGLYSHRYSQASRQPAAWPVAGRQDSQVSGHGRHQPTPGAIFARRGLRVQVPPAPPTSPLTSGNANRASTLTPTLIVVTSCPPAPVTRDLHQVVLVSHGRSSAVSDIWLTHPPPGHRIDHHRHDRVRAGQRQRSGQVDEVSMLTQVNAARLQVGLPCSPGSATGSRAHQPAGRCSRRRVEPRAREGPSAPMRNRGGELA
jgi:hypothetical protein